MQLAATAPTSVITPPRGLTGIVDTRPVPVRELPSLRLGSPDSQGNTHVSAASGIAAVPGGSAWVASDDLPQLVRFTSLTSPGTAVDALTPARKKPDLESIVVLPSSRWGAPPIVFAAGSGSTPERHRGTAIEVDAKGAPTSLARTIDLAPLHAALSARLPMGTNIEGMALRQGAAGAELLLFHRGQVAGDRNVVFTLDAVAAVTAIRAGTAIPASSIRGERTVDLGQLNGAPLGFADARALPDGRIAFIASAEASAPTGDGPILGSVVGMLDRDLRVIALRPLEGPARKAEGIEVARHADPAAGPDDYVLVTDPDDPAKPAEVLAVTL